jgi:MFS family permease
MIPQLNFLFLSIGNIFWVPVAMKFGKRASLLSSMAMQAGMLAWTAATPSFNGLLAARCLQGFAAAAGEVHQILPCPHYIVQVANSRALNRVLFQKLLQTPRSCISEEL